MLSGYFRGHKMLLCQSSPLDQFLRRGDCKYFDAVSELKPYGELTKDQLEYVNHVEKRMGTQLRELKRISRKNFFQKEKKNFPEKVG